MRDQSVHGDELNGHSVIFTGAANDSAATHLADRKVQQDLNEAAKGKARLGANKKPANAKAFHKRDTTLRPSLPGGNRTLGRFHTEIASLLGSDHSKALRAA